MTTDEALEVLGVATDTPPGDVRRAYLRAVKAHPPESDPEGFARVRDAYELVVAEEHAPSSVPPVDALPPEQGFEPTLPQPLRASPLDEAAHPTPVVDELTQVRHGARRGSIGDLRRLLEGYPDAADADELGAGIAASDAEVRLAAVRACLRLQKDELAAPVVCALLDDDLHESHGAIPPIDDSVELLLRLAAGGNFALAGRVSTSLERWLGDAGALHVAHDRGRCALALEVQALGGTVPEFLRRAIARSVLAGDPELARTDLDSFRSVVGTPDALLARFEATPTITRWLLIRRSYVKPPADPRDNATLWLRLVMVVLVTLFVVTRVAMCVVERPPTTYGPPGAFRPPSADRAKINPQQLAAPIDSALGKPDCAAARSSLDEMRATMQTLDLYRDDRYMDVLARRSVRFGEVCGAHYWADAAAPAASEKALPDGGAP